MNTTDTGPRRWATLPEAAEHMQVNVTTVRRLIAKGTIPGYRLGKRIIRVDLAEVDAILAGSGIPSAKAGSGVRSA